MSPATSHGLLILTSSDVDQIIPKFSTTELTALMAHAFMLSLPLSSASPPSSAATGSAYTPHRTSIPSKNHTVLFMPARIGGNIVPQSKQPVPQSGVEPSSQGFLPAASETTGATCVKVASVPNSSTDTRGLPASTLVLDEETGSVRAVINARNLTAIRTAAGSLLSTILVGPRRPTSIAAFGTGKQIEAHLLLHLSHFPSISACTVLYRTDTRVSRLRSSLEHRFPAVRFTYLSSSNERARQAVQEASIIVCATSSTIPLFPSKWVKDGTHVILVGSFKPEMKEVETALIRRAIPEPSSSPSIGQSNLKESRGNRTEGKEIPDRILLADSRSACKLESGEIIDANLHDEDMIEIGEFLSTTPLEYDRKYPTATEETGNRSNRSQGDTKGSTEANIESEETHGPITMFKSVGLGVQDVVMASAVLRKAEEIGDVGIRILNYDGSG